MPVEIPLTRGLVAVVDEADAPAVGSMSWHAVPNEHRCYAATGGDPLGIGVQTTYMHRYIMRPPEGVFVDHINGDGLDNRRENLRLAECWQNTVNSRRRSDNTSGFKGVTYQSNCNVWHALIVCRKRQYRLGYHETAYLASLAYDCAARNLFGEFALLNHPEIEAYPFTFEQVSARPTKTSKFRGVYLERTKTGLERWCAAIITDGRQKKIGRFVSESDAARAYDERARALWGDKAPLNFP